MIRFQRFSFFGMLTFAAAAVVSLVGCGPRDDRVKLPTAHVEGTFYVNDKPFGPARLLLTPIPTDGSRPVVQGFVAEGGTYKLSTYSRADEDADGAPPGEYQVGFTMDAMNPGKALPILKRGGDTIKIPEDTSGNSVKFDIKVTSTGKEAQPMAGGKLPGAPGAPGPGSMMGPPGRR